MRWLTLSIILINLLLHPWALSAETGDRPLLNLLTLHNPPLSYMDENGALKGALVDVVREAVRRTDRAVNITLIPWARAQQQVKMGHADGIFNLGYTQRRDQWAHFSSEVLFMETYTLFTTAGRETVVKSNLSNIADLTVGTQSGYVYGGVFQQAMDQEYFKTLKSPAATIEQNLMLLDKKRIDFFVADMIPALHVLEGQDKGEQVKVVKRSERDQQDRDLVVSEWSTYMAFSEASVSRDYADQFSHSLQEMKRDGSYRQIMESYLEPYDGFDRKGYRQEYLR